MADEGVKTKASVKNWILTKRDKDPITGEDYLFEVKVGSEGKITKTYSLANGDDLSPWNEF